MVDKYCSYEELRAAEAPDAFQITVSDRNTPAVIVAPHGGKIEIGTTQIAEAIAQTDFSIYAFDGKKASDNTDLHITSTRFDEPMARALVARSEYCITVHGAAGAGELVFLGGLHEELKALLRDRLTEAGFEPAESSDPDLQGTNPLNICNRGASRAGVQLEIMRGLRDALTDQTDPEAPDRLATFAGAVRGAIESMTLRGYDCRAHIVSLLRRASLCKSGRVSVGTDRLVLRRARMDDAEDLHRVFADPRAMRYWDSLPHEHIDQTRRWLAGMVAFSPAETDDFVLEHEGRVIGKAGCWRLGEIGFILHPVYWRRGLAREALRAAIPRIFASLPIDRLEAEVDPRIAAALRLLGHFGFYEVRGAERTVKLGAEWCDSVYLELPRPS